MLKRNTSDRAIIVSSGRGVHEALAAAQLCGDVTVVDMPSIDEALLLELYETRKPLLIAEQNNGYIWQNFLKVLYKHRGERTGTQRLFTVNTLDANLAPQFIHSATYEELIDMYGLSASKLAKRLEELS